MNASLQSAGADLVVLTTDGDLLVVKRNPARHSRRSAATKSHTAQTWPQPVLLGKEIIVRDVTSVAVLTL